ncbi:hypothetical protein B0H13DRAFT_1933218 [Mycena leptocephala]|nr:hypothetical protein B0H13DRAFT_1933218 [Mycena leptocephala]
MADGDSDMSAPWDNDDNWIEDRCSRGTTYERGHAGYWAGDANTPTYVYPLGASLSTPPLPFRGIPNARGLPCAAQKKPEQADRGRYADSGSTSGSGSDYPLHQRVETLRLQALSSRSRFRDEPAWGGRCQRYDPRNSRADYDKRDFSVAMEEERLACNAAKKNRNAPQAPHQRDERLGIWQHLTIANLLQALNLIEWMDQGDESAYELFRFIIQNVSAEPGTFRTEGENHIIIHQGRLDRDWWITTRGVAHDQSAYLVNAPARAHRMHHRCAPSPRRLWDHRTAQRWSGWLAPPPRARPTNRARAPPGGYALEGRGYLGTSPPDPADEAPPMAATGEFRAWRALPNMLGTVVDVMRHYFFADTHTWAVGIRNMLGERRRPGGDTVHTGDALAYQTCIALGPDDRHGLDHQWRHFYETLVLMFSIPGLYAHIVSVGGYPEAALPMVHYPYLTDNITMPLVAAWLVQHGIPATGAAPAAIEEFARSRCNIRASIEDLSNVGWADEPRSVTSALAVDHASIPSWANLCHAPSIRAPDAVRNPGATVVHDGVAASMHAPDMDVDMTAKTDDPLPPPPVTPSDEGDAADFPQQRCIKRRKSWDAGYTMYMFQTSGLPRI